MKIHGILLLAAVCAPLPAADFTPPPASEQIAGAVQAAPEDRRDGAAVLGYDSSGKLVNIRKGSNDLICIADDPRREKFNVACYHKDLEPYMTRGRELREQGVTGQDRYDIRWKEIEEGKLAIPREPRTLYVLSGSSFDPAANQVADRYLRWVVYIPYATAESTGLPTKPGPNVPWLMFPGTPGAHIMISPAKN